MTHTGVREGITKVGDRGNNAPLKEQYKIHKSQSLLPLRKEGISDILSF